MSEYLNLIAYLKKSHEGRYNFIKFVCNGMDDKNFAKVSFHIFIDDSDDVAISQSIQGKGSDNKEIDRQLKRAVFETILSHVIDRLASLAIEDMEEAHGKPH